MESSFVHMIIDWSLVLCSFAVVPSCSSILPVVRVRKKGVHKMPDVDVGQKQRVVVEFLTGENVSPRDIHKRLGKVYGNWTIDLGCVQRWAKRPGESDLCLGGRLMQRTVIQFLAAEGNIARDIKRRLCAVYRTVAYSECSIWRWASRYLTGETGVGDRDRKGRPLGKPQQADASTPTNDTYLQL